MDIENYIKNLFIETKFIGDVIRFAAFLEFYLDCTLDQYFIRGDRTTEGLEFLLSELNFGRKIDILAKLPIRKSTSSYQKAITGLRRFQRIRNVAAHSWTVSTSEIKRLLNDHETKRILVAYPDSIEKDFQLTRNALCRLIRTKEFINPNAQKLIDPYDKMFYRIFET